MFVLKFQNMIYFLKVNKISEQLFYRMLKLNKIRRNNDEG